MPSQNSMKINANELRLNKSNLILGIDKLNNKNGDIIRLAFDNVVNLGELKKQVSSRKKNAKNNKNLNLNNADNYKLLLCYNKKKIAIRQNQLTLELKTNLTKVQELLTTHQTDIIMNKNIFHCISDERGGGGILVTFHQNDYLLTAAHLFENELYTGNNIKLGIIICSNTQRLILINNQLCIISLIDSNSYNTELDIALCKIVSVLLNNEWIIYNEALHRQYLNFLSIGNSDRVLPGEELILKSLNITKIIQKRNQSENKTCGINLGELDLNTHANNQANNLEHMRKNNSKRSIENNKNNKNNRSKVLNENNYQNSLKLEPNYNFGKIINVYVKDFKGKKNEYALKPCKKCAKEPFSSMLIDEGGSYCRIHSKSTKHEINENNIYKHLSKEELKEINDRGELWDEKSGYSMIYDMNTIGGNSGYPLFSINNSNELLGIHTSKLPLSDAENTEDDTEVGAGVDINTIIDFINYYESL